MRWAEARPWHTNVALSLIGCGMVYFTRQLAREYSHYEIGFSGTSGACLSLYLAAVLILLIERKNVDRFTLPIIFIFAIICRLVLLFPAPYLSTDIYRYVWDGIVQHAGVNPYRYVPGDAALAWLREPHADVYEYINRREYAHTIYPPAAQMVFYLITWVSPTMRFMKVAMVLFEAVAVYGLMTLLKAMGRRREWILLYAWMPMLIWEFAGSGHLDAIVLGFVALAMLARYRKQPVLTGVFLGLAVLTKFYPLVLFPAFYMRRDWKMPATMVGLAAACYAVYLSAGKMVFGFLGGYAKEEGMQTGTRYFLYEWVQRLPGMHWLTNNGFLVFAGLVMLGLTVWAWRVATPVDSPRDAFLGPAMRLALALMLLFSPHYPWYVAWLVPLFVVRPSLTVLTYVGGLFYLCTTALAVGYGPKQYELNEYLYGWVAAAFVVEIVLRRMRWYRELGWSH
jgi:alpha-1,6-mannosyltransferase